MSVMDEKRRILIIGAGASGMSAALSAAKNGALVTVAEHNSEAGNKILITGNGRCNYTNTFVSPEHYRCNDKELIGSVLASFGYDDCIKLFKGLGIEPNVIHYRFDESGYVYPKDGGAALLRDALFKGCLDEGVSFLFNTDAVDLSIVKNEDVFNTSIGEFDAVIIASGSNAYPATGSDSSVYPILKQFDLGFKPFLPALCALYSKSPLLKELKGKRVEGSISLIIGEDKTYTAAGEIQFNEHSISGIPVMQLSGYAAGALKEKKSCRLIFEGNSFEIHRTAGFDRAQCCSGGIDTDEIIYETLESRRCSGIYFCGELIDAYGECGGYNLHFAWASGFVAGRSAALGK